MILETILAPNICFVVSLQESKMLHLHEGIGVCEQLMGIPIPLSYTRLTSRFLVFWHLTLPIILWDECHWIVVPATFISAASLFCIEEVRDTPTPPLSYYYNIFIFFCLLKVETFQRCRWVFL